MSEELLRTFISIRIPAFKTIRDVIYKFKDLKNIRSPPFDQIHMTLCFIGDVNATLISELCNRIESALSNIEEFDVILKNIGTFPNKGDPRIIWIGLEADPLNCIVSKISKELDLMNLNYDRKTFVPHTTIGRVNGKTDIQDIIEKNRNIEFGSFRCDHIDIMKSIINQSETKHTIIRSVKLIK